jgi:hypothetical protein
MKTFWKNKKCNWNISQSLNQNIKEKQFKINKICTEKNIYISQMVKNRVLLCFLAHSRIFRNIKKRKINQKTNNHNQTLNQMFSQMK